MIELQPVQSTRDRKRFHSFPRKLYAEDAEFVSHIDQDVEAVFDPVKNINFTEGDAKRWLAYRGGEVVGRIAAFYNAQQSGIGFFESVNDQEVANALFHTAEQWLKDKGQTEVEAPVNFGERDRYWGLLVEGFERPSYQEPYNFPYYRQLFEHYGYQKAFEQTTSEVYPDRIGERFEKYMRFASKTPWATCHYSRKEHNRFVKAFTQIYNEAWGGQEFYIPLKEERVAALFKSLRPVIRDDLMWFVFDGERPVAFYISILDINPIFRHVRGNLNWWGKLKFLYYRKRIKIDRVRGVIFGVVPDYQNKGAYSGMLVKMHEVLKEDPVIKSTELSWIGDFNPKMHALFRSLNAQKTKLHFTYKKLL